MVLMSQDWHDCRQLQGTQSLLLVLLIRSIDLSDGLSEVPQLIYRGVPALVDPGGSTEIPISLVS